jgi:hypothetical protein
MNVIAQGKDSVLHFLENEALRRTNETPGEFVLYRDDAGQLVLTLHGLTFFGTGSLSLSGNLLSFDDGLLVKAKKPS